MKSVNKKRKSERNSKEKKKENRKKSKQRNSKEKSVFSVMTVPLIYSLPQYLSSHDSPWPTSAGLDHDSHLNTQNEKPINLKKKINTFKKLCRSPWIILRNSSLLDLVTVNLNHFKLFCPKWLQRKLNQTLASSNSLLYHQNSVKTWEQEFLKIPTKYLSVYLSNPGLV